MKLFIVGAFTDRPFAGNPAAVCLLKEERNADWMQAVAAEMNLSETAFVRPLDDGFELRWFTPAIEVDLCGHATLAAAHALWTEGVVNEAQPIRFHTKSGILTCTQHGDFIELDFPATPALEAEPPAGLLDALGVKPLFVGRSKFDKFLVVETEQVVRSLKPDFAELRQISMRGVIVTSISDDPCFDFVSRYFAPGAGIDEDPVTGSAHCCLGPYWSEQLGKTEMTAFQASARGGIVRVRINGDRVLLGGQAVTVMKGELIEDSRHCRRDVDIASDLTCRRASASDVTLLARMNQQLIEDEASRNSMSLSELESRMKNWLDGEWQAVVIEQNGEPVGYILFQFRSDEYQPSEATVYVRQFFVGREHRSRGIGRWAFDIVSETYFPNVSSVILDVLETNPRALRFWKSLGFQLYCTTLKLTTNGAIND